MWLGTCPDVNGCAPSAAREMVLAAVVASGTWGCCNNAVGLPLGSTSIATIVELEAGATCGTSGSCNAKGASKNAPGCWDCAAASARLAAFGCVMLLARAAGCTALALPPWRLGTSSGGGGICEEGALQGPDCGAPPAPGQRAAACKADGGMRCQRSVQDKTGRDALLLPVCLEHHRMGCLVAHAPHRTLRLLPPNCSHSSMNPCCMAALWISDAFKVESSWSKCL